MTIDEQRRKSPDGDPEYLISGRGALKKNQLQGSMVFGESQGPSMDGVFYMDNIGSPVTINQELAPPEMVRSLSPTCSDSSQEVIVFAGRKHAPPKSSHNKSSSVLKDHSKTDHHSPSARDRSDSPNFATTRPPPRKIATSNESNPSAVPVKHTPCTVYLGEESCELATEDLLAPLRMSRQGRRKQQGSRKGARPKKEEDEILADYIKHMDNDETSDETFTNLAQDNPTSRAPSIELGVRAVIDGDADEVGRSSPFGRSPFRDLTIARGFNDDSDLSSSADEESDQSDDEAQIAADVQDYMDDIEDERDLLERKQARMTDERIARLLTKQDELGLSSSELLLFDGNEVENEVQYMEVEDDGEAVFLRSSAADRTARRMSNKTRHRFNGTLPSARLTGEKVPQDPYGDFDIMDRDRPSLNRTAKNRRNAPAFELSDIELQATILRSWEKDRSKKKIRKKEREELRAQGLLSGQNQTDIKVKYREGISYDEVKDELLEFMMSSKPRYYTFWQCLIIQANFHSLALPPMANKDRRIVHEMAHVLRLKSKSSGIGKSRFPVLYKTGRTGDLDETVTNALQSLSKSQRFFPRKDVKGQRRSAVPRRARRNGGDTSGVSYRDGEVVGAAAPEIGIENRGRAMLEKMGWSKGTALGALNNKGMLQPVIPTIKTTKAGLG